jgi:hypothetical protein
VSLLYLKEVISVHVGHKARNVLKNFRHVYNETVSNLRHTCVNNGFGGDDGFVFSSAVLRTQQLWH